MGKQRPDAAMFNCAMKVCIIAFLSVVGMTTFGRYLNTFKASFTNMSFSNYISLLLQLDITVFVLLFLIWQIPKLVQGLLSGSPQFGAGQMVAIVQSGIATAARVAGGAAGVAALAGAAAGGGSAPTIGGGAPQMSSIANPSGGTPDATGMTPGIESPKPDMSKYNGSAPSTPTDAGTEKGGSTPASASKTPAAADQASSSGGGSGGGLSSYGNIGKAIGNLATHAAFNSAPVKAFQQSYNAVTDPYGLGPAGKAQGATGRSWKSGHMTDADGNFVEGGGSRGSKGSIGGGEAADGKSPETDGAEERQHEKKVTDNIVTVHSANLTDTGGAMMDLNIKGQDIRVTVNPVPPPITPFNPNGK